MKTLQFQCTLLTDVILNTKAASEGNNTTLDFIPGNNFLGIVAKHYDKFSEAEQIEVFHSGKVRFGDAHPVAAGHEGIRSVRVPFSMFHPKMKKATEECYIHHFYNEDEDEDNPLQLKQCRTGFYAFEQQKGFLAATKRSFAIKSAYDREQRRSQDEQMYGYESLDAGLSFLFEVECDSDAIADKIKSMLVGTRRIGRSRTAQYGLVKIEEKPFANHKGNTQPFSIGKDQYIAIYADSRLIFLDENDACTFQPTPKQLGIKDEKAEIDWRKSQVRTFQYAPWNFQRQCRDTDRCGLEKGSVLVVKTSVPVSAERACVGSYQNEGFGKVIYNPEFLQAKDGTNGEARYRLQDETKPEPKDKSTVTSCNTPLLTFMRSRKKTEEADSEILKCVNAFKTTNKSLFSGDKFASQWGTIRSIAMRETDPAELMKKLFGNPKEKDGEMEGYLTHGTAKDKWADRNRLNTLKEFAENNESNLRKALINLASEMAKIKNEKK